MIKIKHAPPISQAIPLSPDDLIRIEIISSTVPVELVLEGSCYNSQGDIVPFIETLNVTVALTPAAFNIRLGYEFLFSAVLHTRTSGIPDGSCYCRMSLCKSETGGVFPFRKLLAQGYVATTASIGYGSAAILGAPTDHFFIENIIEDTPPAGDPVDFLCPDYSNLEIICASVDSLTSAIVATRQGSLQLIRPSGVPHIFKVSVNQDAGANYRYTFFPGTYGVAGITANSYNVPIPKIILQPGSTLRFTLFSIQADDEISNFSLYVKRQTIPFT